MRIGGFIIFEKTPEASAVPNETKSFMLGEDAVSSAWIPIRTKLFNGEKSDGELGSPYNLLPDYRILRARAYEAKMTSDVVKIIINKFFKWVVGTGLKLQSEPSTEVLDLEKITFEHSAFVNNVEAYFTLYAANQEADFSNMCTLHELASKAFETAFLGGDSLVILRLDDNYDVRVQVIDGQHVVDPLFESQFIQNAKAKGNTIRHGIEIDDKGEHIAFYVLKSTPDNFIGEIERIPARSEQTGCLMAWMVYGDKHRIDHLRGIPVITPILEKVTKLDRYTEASVSAAEERAKVPWYIKHSRFSDGENPLANIIKKNAGGSVDLDPYKIGEALSKNITATENKTVYNLPIGAELSGLDAQAELSYDPFFKAVFVQLCAAVDIPPEVAIQQYNSNYSASRAAINGWGFIIDIYRDKFATNFYKKIYKFWLHVHVLKNKVQAPGYLSAVNTNNTYIINAYSNSRFTGTKMPHIDPKKEMDAIRGMLGDDTTPLISFEQATEQLGFGEWTQNYKKVQEERKVLDTDDVEARKNKTTKTNQVENATDSETEE